MSKPTPYTPGSSKNIALDPNALRREVAHAEYYGLSPADSEAIAKFGDDRIRAALARASDEDYWRAYEDTCVKAISLLRRQIPN